MEELRTFWQVPSIAHFCYLFKDGLKVPKLDYQQLEIAFLTPVPIASEEQLNLGSQEQHVIVDLAVALLRGYFNNPKINASNWEHYLKKIFNILHVGREGLRSPFVIDTFDSEGRRIEKELSFNDLSLRDRADVIYHLCEYRLYADDASDAASILVEDELRIEPIGTDSKGNVYWYFYGTRLYRENPEAAKKVENRLTALKRYKEYFGREEQKKTTKDSCTSKSSAPVVNNKVQQLKSSIPAERSSSRRSKPVDRLNGETLRNSHYKRPKLEEQTNAKNRNNNKSSSKKSSTSTDFDALVGPDPNTSCGVALSDLQAAWTCVCSTESEWESLIDWLQKCKVPCSIELYQLLSQNFLPQIKELFAEAERVRVREEKQKLLELVPRRSSSRIGLKKIQQEEEERRAGEAREDERRRRAQAEERSKAEEDRRRKQAVQREREERARQRQAIMEDRAARAALRAARDKSKSTFHDKNANVSDDDVDLSDASVSLVTSNGWPLSDTHNGSSIDDRNKFFSLLSKVLASVSSNRDAWPFKEAVDAKIVPLYYQVIEEPIDLSIIQSKIESQSYYRLREVELDFKLMVNNCETFNGPKNGYTSMVYAVWKTFRRAVRRYFHQDLEEDEQTVFLYPPKLTSQPPTAAIEARRRKHAHKHRRGMKALEVLERAAEYAVKDTQSSKSSSSIPPSPSTSSIGEDSNKPSRLDFIIFDELDKNDQVSGPLSGEALAKYLYAASNDCNLTTFYVDPSDNLTFKSLAEWSDSIKSSGTRIVLPHDAVVLSPAAQVPQCSDEGMKFLTLQVMSESTERMTDHSLQADSNGNSFQLKEERTEKRLVIKLSRCSDSSRQWRPVQIVNDGESSFPKLNTQMNENLNAIKNDVSTHVNEREEPSCTRNKNVQINFDEMRVSEDSLDSSSSESFISDLDDLCTTSEGK